MTNSELEELIYEYGNVMYKLGRMETDDKVSSKEYSKFYSSKEKLMNKFDEYFKTSINKKAKNSLGIF